MKKVVMATAAAMIFALAGVAGAAQDQAEQINPYRAKLENLNKEVQAINKDAKALGIVTVTAPVMVPVSALALPHRYIEAGDDYAKAIPGPVGRFAARASLAPFRVAAFIPAIPWYIASYTVGALVP